MSSLTEHKNSTLLVWGAAELSNFFTNSGESSIEIRYQNENTWLTQKDDRALWC